MSSNQDLLSILSSAGASRSPLHPPLASASGIAETSILSFKAGKMIATLQPNGKFLVEPESRLGELHVVWTSIPITRASTMLGESAISTVGEGGGYVKIEWRDRRTKTTMNAVRVFPNEEDALFERVETGRYGDRVYRLRCNDGACSSHFFWMQDKDANSDEEMRVKVNFYMIDRVKAATAAEIVDRDAISPARVLSAVSSENEYGMDSTELLRVMQGALGSHEAVMLEAGEGQPQMQTNAVTIGTGNALGTILDHLDISGVTGGVAGQAMSACADTATSLSGGLTLADLQGAMAGLATASPALFSPPLSELASANVVHDSGILKDSSCVARLIACLPEGQRTKSSLLKNIRSPQVALCFNHLTSTLSDNGGFKSIIANFQLNPKDGAVAMEAGNPVGAFLNCILRDVERKEDAKENGKDNNDDKGNVNLKGGDLGQDMDANMDEC